MLQKILTISLALAATVLVACGGTDPTELTQEQKYESLLNEVNLAKAEAEANAASGPCTHDDQCSTLILRSPLPPCYFTTVVDYSTATPTAAAVSAAAARHDSAAEAAEAIAPPSDVSGSCFSQTDSRPLLCMEGSCQRGFRF